MRHPSAARERSLILSLFPGIGLLDQAFEEVGFCVVRGPDVLWGGDIRAFHPPAGVFDGVIGGPPCQTFSPLANLVRAKGHEPRFGNLIPEFSRCVSEALPRWFLMENVPQAPEPEPKRHYSIRSFVLDNCTLDAGDGYGQEQERKRRFTFGVRQGHAPDLRRWIQQAALLLPRVNTVTQYPVDNSPEAKGRTPAVTGREGGVEARAREGAVLHAEVCATRARERRCRQRAVLSDPHPVPVAIGGSGKRKPGARVPAVTAAHSGAAGRPKGGHLIVYRWLRMLELQGLPPDFLEHAPFTADGKKKAVANGVPLPMGRAIARAVIAALRRETEAMA